MSNIKLARVDDRLIHGQVMTNWVQYTSAKQIVIIDDGLVADEFTSKVMSMAVPENIKLRIITLDQAKRLLQKDPTRPTILLAKTPKIYLELIKNGVDIPAVNIGGIGANHERTTLHKNISASEEERKAMNEILDNNVSINIQVISNDNTVRITKEMLDI